MKYSIIIPVYNRPEEVDELLASIAAQTVKDFEVIVVEDGSSVPGEEGVKKYCSPPKGVLEYFLTMSSHGTLEPSSTTITSKPFTVCAARLASSSSTSSGRLYTGITIEYFIGKNVSWLFKVESKNYHLAFRSVDRLSEYQLRLIYYVRAILVDDIR